jgi:carbamoyltransferase
MAKTNDLLLGHATTWHDPAFAYALGDRLWAEAVERPSQCKRALQMEGAWYAWRALAAALAEPDGELPNDLAVTSLIPWSAAARSDAFDLEHAGRQPLACLIKAASLLEPITIHQLRWTLRGHPPRPFGVPDGRSPGALPERVASWQAKALVHQLAHAANAVYTSPFDECAVMVLDGYSENTAISFFHFRDGELELLHQARPEVSLGLLYAAVTQLCGFDPYAGEEWKVMGLAAFGQRDPAIDDFFRSRLVVDGLDLAFHAPGRGLAFDRSAWAELETRCGGFRPPGDPDVLRAANLARSFQDVFADTVLALARNLGERGLSRNLAYAGGCALNSALNGRLVPETPFESLHVPSAPGDDGNALGVVLYEKHRVRGEPRTAAAASPYLGSRVRRDHLERAIELGDWPAVRAADEEELVERVAEELAGGRIVGWVQGRAEFGPRALGNRSILADPRDAGMKDRINARVKFREFYRPLAPAILAEHGPHWFEDFQESPYMERTLRFRPEVRERVPAVVHQDGTGRLQTVGRDLNPRFRRLIEAFHRRTGVPILLNTSLNVMGKPIVHSVEDAVTVFATTGLDLLVVEERILSKRRG